METELRLLEESPQVNIHSDGPKTSLKKIANWKTPGFDGIHGFWFNKFTSIHDKLATETCLPLMWKILTAQIKEKIYYSLISRGIFPDEEKGCRKKTRGTEELLYIDQQIPDESKKRRKNLAMAFTKKLTIRPPKAGHNTVSKCIKCPTKLYNLSKRPCKRGEWNIQQEGKA